MESFERRLEKKLQTNEGQPPYPFFGGFLVSKVCQYTRFHICITTKLGKMTTQSRTSERLKHLNVYSDASFSMMDT